MGLKGFKYKKDSVMQVTKECYKQCNSSHPRFYSNTGKTRFMFDHSEQHYRWLLKSCKGWRAHKNQKTHLFFLFCKRRLWWSFLTVHRLHWHVVTRDWLTFIYLFFFLKWDKTKKVIIKKKLEPTFSPLCVNAALSSLLFHKWNVGSLRKRSENDRWGHI